MGAGTGEKLKIEELLNRGFTLQTQERFKDAIVFFSEVIRIEPGHAVAYHRRGIAQSILGEHELAIEDYDEAIRLSPELAAAYANRGNAYYALGTA